MIDELLLLSGNDIPFPIARLTIHQPRLTEIALINEKNFWQGCGLLKFNKNNLEDKVKNDLSNQSNFNIIMSMIQGKGLEAQQAKINILSIFTLIFPIYKIKLEKKTIQLYDQNNVEEIREINENNFEILRDILIDMFCLKNNEKQYDPSGQLSKKIADKIARGKQKRAELAPKTSISILSRYASILAVGQQKDMNSLMNYTVYQITDEFTRYQLKLHYDTYDRYRRAGATGLKQPEDWLKDIYEKD